MLHKQLVIYKGKALSIKEPYSTLILKGKKTIETRTWKTNYRGELLLCASKKPASAISGCAFAVAKLSNCLPMQEIDEKLACCEIYNNAYSWFLKDIQAIKPIPVKGKLGLFEINIEIEYL